MVKAQKPAWQDHAGFLWLKWGKINTVQAWTTKTSSNTGSDTYQCQKPPFEPFPPLWFTLPQVGRLRFSTVTLQSADGVSFILPHVWFGSYWVTTMDLRLLLFSQLTGMLACIQLFIVWNPTKNDCCHSFFWSGACESACVWHSKLKKV